MTWGIVSTVKTDVDSLKNFVAYHLSIGADWIALYFDEPNDRAIDAIHGIAKVSVTRCTQDHWQAISNGRKGRVAMRQSYNAMHAYQRCPVDWLAHIDADEFIHSDIAVSEILDAELDKTIAVRMEPIEYLEDCEGDDSSNGPQCFKAAIKPGGRQLETAQKLYSHYGSYISSGMLSHRNGKIFVRRNIENLKLGVHKALLNEQDVQVGFHSEFLLCHFHAASYDDWRSKLSFRMQQGAYVKHLDKPYSRVNLLFTSLLDDADGEAALRAFYNAFQVASPTLQNNLSREGLLHTVDLRIRERVESVFAGRPDR